MSEETQLTIEPGQPTITLKRAFDASRELVFEAWTNLDRLKRWYDLKDFKLADCTSDLRVGGKWRVYFQNPDGQDHGVSGEYQEISPPERLVQVYHFDGEPTDEVSETLEFAEVDGRTILTSTVAHTSVEKRDRHLRLGATDAAKHLLDSLADHLRWPERRRADAITSAKIALPAHGIDASAAGVHERTWDWRVGAGGLSVLLALFGAVYWFWPRAAAVNYLTEVVDRGPIIQEISAPGLVLSEPPTVVKAFVTGKIESVHCEPGAKIHAGQLCAKIDPRPFEANVTREKLSLAAAKTRVENARPRLNAAKASARRGGGGASPNYEESQARVKEEEARVAQFQASVRAAERDLVRTDIVSPVSGTVVSRNVEPGQMVVGSDEPLFAVAPELTTTHVEAKLNSKEAEEVAIGDEASFTAAGVTDRVFPGKVTQISQSSPVSQDAQQNDIVIDARNSDLLLKPGVTGTIEFKKVLRDDTLRVPNRSLQYASSKRVAEGEKVAEPPEGWTRVWVLRNKGPPAAVNVRLGAHNGVHTQVVEGDLRAGDQLIVGKTE
jgi:HlyD family secretion protein